MATTSKINPSHEDKGKMIVAEPDIPAVADLTSTDYNKTIEVIVVPPIQANMRFEDTDYFDQLLQLHTAYKISGFNCERTSPLERTLQNDTSLIFGKYIHLHPVPNIDFPEHYFNFAAYNELARRANVKNAVLTDYIARVRAISGVYTFGDTTTQRKYQRIIDIENLRPEQLPDTMPFLIVNNQPYEDLNQERTTNHFPLATLLEVNPQNYQRVRFTADATIYRINTKKDWYYQKCITCGEGMEETHKNIGKLLHSKSITKTSIKQKSYGSTQSTPVSKKKVIDYLTDNKKNDFKHRNDSHRPSKSLSMASLENEQNQTCN
ncbi:hypothetical protein Tco_0758307 [Tanacetum coccineum]